MTLAAQNFDGLAALTSYPSVLLTDGQAYPYAEASHTGTGVNDWGFQTTWHSGATGNPNSGGDTDVIGVFDSVPPGASGGPVTGGSGGPIATDHVFFVEDPDGRVDVTFDAINLTGITDAVLSLNYWFADTTYEPGETFQISITDGTVSSTLLNLSNTQIEALGSPDATPVWTPYSVDLDLSASNAGLNLSQVSVVVSFESTAASEEMAFDNFLVSCFGEETHIRTETGDVMVKDVRIGDRILTASGDIVAVRWIGRQVVSTRFGPAERLMPVRVHAGALGNGLPRRDLTLTADHALLIDGVLIDAGALVNGSSVSYVPLSEFGGTYTVYHIETENHDVILAEGTAAETYIDYVGRQAFDNYAEYRDLYGEDSTIPEMVYPRISSARMLPAHIRAQLAPPVAA